MENPRRGEVWIVNLDPAVGAEIKKRRPALVISNDLNNRYAATVTVLPITDKGEKVYPFEVPLSAQEAGLDKASKIKCQQIRTIDKGRLIKSLGIVSDERLRQIQQALGIHLGMDD